jgi:hypothetical protein
MQENIPETRDATVIFFGHQVLFYLYAENCTGIPQTKNPERLNALRVSVVYMRLRAYASAVLERAFTFLVSLEIFLAALFLWIIPFELALLMVFIAF